ncbi:hypothetical protein NDU88_005928 [Pleurodeles waltl]|uniref:Uncharacterized protein n=1 Tax=Pleurodeles waltl TaxID=8319 RepID=A0AAV7TWT4_PLEWA|nr:hypothetical protein NDU88_005928 [Pleurodeles waltl]
MALQPEVKRRQGQGRPAGEQHGTTAQQGHVKGIGRHSQTSRSGGRTACNVEQRPGQCAVLSNSGDGCILVHPEVPAHGWAYAATPQASESVIVVNTILDFDEDSMEEGELREVDANEERGTGGKMVHGRVGWYVIDLFIVCCRQHVQGKFKGVIGTYP